ncbi:MAG: hypothetical protein JSW39_07400 [Desulfobacterales bacterium]|nr:MAG: hypothetical protein JSW39_07400 [Desulfobacterales bacterium]
MKEIRVRMEPQDKKKLRLENGRIYFSRAAERKFFFSLTVIMLLLGVLFRLGVLQ